MSPRAIIYGLLALALVAFASLVVEKLLEGARLEALQDVEDANRKSDDNASAGQAAVDACYRDGGRWDRFSGVCNNNARQ